MRIIRRLKMRYSRKEMKNRYNENKKISYSNQIRKCKLRKYKIISEKILYYTEYSA